jgi:hypothetical protein
VHHLISSQAAPPEPSLFHTLIQGAAEKVPFLGSYKCKNKEDTANIFFIS